MIKKVLAVCRGHEITTQFLYEDEYNMYCNKVMCPSLDIALTNLSLDEIIELWQAKNGDCTDEIAENVGAVKSAGR